MDRPFPVHVLLAGFAAEELPQVVRAYAHPHLQDVEVAHRQDLGVHAELYQRYQLQRLVVTNAAASLDHTERPVGAVGEVQLGLPEHHLSRRPLIVYHLTDYHVHVRYYELFLSLIHISEPTRLGM